MKAVNLLHISDVYLRRDEDFNQNLIVDGAIAHFRSLPYSALEPSLVLLTGDLVQAAGVNGAYESFATFVAKTIDALGIEKKSIVACPGNHDASQEAVGARLKDLEKFRQAASERDSANALVRDSSFAKYVGQVFNDATKAIDSFSVSARRRHTPFWSSYYFSHLDLGVIALNTATLSAAAHSGAPRDEGLLCVPEAAMIAALATLPEGCKPIVIGHHPLEMLVEHNRRTMERILSQRCSAYLYGHMHDPRPRTISTLQGQCLFAQSGALYATRDYWNGCSVVSLILQNQLHTRITYHHWSEDRQELCVAEDLAPNGEFFNPTGQLRIWKENPPALDRKALERWRTDALLPFLEDDCNKSLTPESLDQVFVHPEFERAISLRSEAEDQISRSEILSFRAAFEAETNFVISAPAESGKTTCIKQWALLQAKRTALHRNWSAPVVLNFNDLRTYVAQIEGLIKQRLPGLPEGVSFEGLMNSGAVTVLLDDVNFGIREKKDAFAKLISKYPRCRYVLCSSVPLLDGAGIEPVVAPDVPFTLIRMRPIKKGQLLLLIEKHGDARSTAS